MKNLIKRFKYWKRKRRQVKEAATLKVHEVAHLNKGDEYVHATLTTARGVNYNLWITHKDNKVTSSDISSPYFSDKGE